MNEVKTPKKPVINFWISALMVLLCINIFLKPYIQKMQIQDVKYSTFISQTEKKQVKEVEVQENKIVFTLKDDDKIYETAKMNDPELIDRLSESGAKFSGEINETMSPLASFLLTWILPILFFMWLGKRMQKSLMDKSGGGAGSMMFGMGKSNAKIYVQSTNGIKFSDVAGEDEAKENLQEIVDYLHDPNKYKTIGASMPKGVLLVGPPGTGKTMLAKAVAGESNVPFFSISGSEFVEMFVGMGASKVRDLFKQAKEKAPCIVFIDEIDTIGKKRDGQVGGNDEREQTLNQLLTEMDGFEGNNGVIILAATNRPDSLDPALTRPGRFDRRVPVELPDLKGREAILRVHAKKIKVEPNVDYEKIARMASGASGAELANIVNEAALRAVRDKRHFATEADLEESIEVVIAGYQKKNAILTDREKWTVSYHEIGHALVAAKQLCTGSEDYHHSANFRSAGIHHAGRRRKSLPDDQEGDGEPNCHLYRRQGGRGNRLRGCDHRRLQRYRAGHQDGPCHDYPIRNEFGLRYGGVGDGVQPIPGRRCLTGMLGGDPEEDRREGGSAGASAA